MFQKLKHNKKGIETGLVDFYATIVIALIIIIFFFVLHIQGTKMTYGVTGQAISLSLDAKSIGLAYLRQTVSYEEKTYTVAELLILTQQDEKYKKVLEDVSESFASAMVQPKGTTKEGIGIRVYYQEKNVGSYGALSIGPEEEQGGPLGEAPPAADTGTATFILPTSNPNEPLTVIVLFHCQKGEKC